MKPDDIDLESHVGVNLGRLDERVRAQLAEFVANREQRLAELRERALDAEQEASALRNRVESLQEQVESLDQGASRRQTSGPALDTETLVGTFGDALSSDRISRSGFAVSDLSVDIRANVVHTEDGVRVTLPDPGSHPSPEGLSQIRFSVRSDPEAAEPDLEEVPDLVGMTEPGARETLQTAGFEVGSVETVAADAEPGRVVDQLPSPDSLAEPGAAVDLEIEEPAEEAIDLVGETFADVVRFAGDRFSLQEIRAVESPESPGTVLEQDPAPGEAASGDRLSVTISAYPESADEAPPEPGAEKTDEPAKESGETAEEAPGGSDESGTDPSDEQTGPRFEASSPPADELLAAAADAAPDDVDSLVERDVEEINGIGDTYGQRLRNTGIETLADLAVAEPARVADAANVPDDRAVEWIEAVLDIARDMAGEATGTGGT